MRLVRYWALVNLRSLSSRAVGINTVKRIELTDEITGSARTLWKIQNALEAAGVEFIPADDEKGPGLRLKHKVREKRVKRAGIRGK